MRLPERWEGKLAVVEGFTQRTPDDGRAATQATEAYLGYDQRNLYVIFVSHDTAARLVRARLTKREAIADDDDRVGIYVDTFGDGRRAYRFSANPLGVQDDAMYSEDADEADQGFDTVWRSRGIVTDRGYVVWMSIPFKSLRFPHERSHTWSLALWRFVGRRAEESWWPRVSSVTRGILSQSVPSDGIANVSPGRNVQFIPYVSGRGSSIDGPAGGASGLDDRANAFRGGLDAKAIIRDSLVLDLTVNPEFSHVESDEPQIAANPRYELFYPERRPFFTENSSYFDVPMIVNHTLVFTRRVVDPQVGARLTGKLGDYSIGALVVNDRAPGRQAAPGSPGYGERAWFNIFRVTRSVGTQSNVGVTYGERRFADSFSRVMDLDTTIRIGRTWKATATGAFNWNRALDGRTSSGGDLDATLTRVGRGFGYIGYYVNRAKGFTPEMAFYNHSDWRELGQTVSYQWWPANSWITRVYGEVYGARNMHHNGDLSWEGLQPLATIDLKHNTRLSGHLWFWRDAFGPRDFPGLTEVMRFPLVRAYGMSGQSRASRLLSIDASVDWGRRPNYVPPPGGTPSLARFQHAEAGLSLTAGRGFRIDNKYLWDRNVSDALGWEIYSSHIARSRVSWQLTRELSVRLIAQYESMRSDRRLTATPAGRGFNADVLLSYLVSPGTALYLGYNSNLADPPEPDGRRGWVNDSRQAFVKLSYLVRF